MYLYICVMSHIHVEIKICFYFWQQYKYEVASSENLIFSPDYLLILTARMIIVGIGTWI